MLGVVGETRFVMGCITQMEDGRYFLEDLSAALPLDLSEAVHAGGFITGQTPLPSSMYGPTESSTHGAAPSLLSNCLFDPERPFHLFCTENSIVVVEGELQHSGVFLARALGLPPIESRELSLAAAKVSVLLTQ